ncbi:MAG: hypothetical protein DMH00_08960 [Acidobacteria bacterium]|nr:MAG: hypothetical protein DMH00_08960 [Acidobacteriota bacterium]
MKQEQLDGAQPGKGNLLVGKACQEGLQRHHRSAGIAGLVKGQDGRNKERHPGGKRAGQLREGHGRPDRSLRIPALGRRQGLQEPGQMEVFDLEGLTELIQGCRGISLGEQTGGFHEGASRRLLDRHQRGEGRFFRAERCQTKLLTDVLGQFIQLVAKGIFGNSRHGPATPLLLGGDFHPRGFENRRPGRSRHLAAEQETRTPLPGHLDLRLFRDGRRRFRQIEHALRSQDLQVGIVFQGKGQEDRRRLPQPGKVSRIAGAPEGNHHDAGLAGHFSGDGTPRRNPMPGASPEQEIGHPRRGEENPRHQDDRQRSQGPRSRGGGRIGLVHPRTSGTP